MRASYRWSVLGLICSWALVVLLLSECDQRKKRMLAYGLGAALFALNLPHLPDQWENNRLNRTKFLELDNGIVASLDRDLGDGEIVAFLPFRNDFLATYVAPRIGIRTFNTGGDKNLEMARLHWPPGMRAFAPGGAGNGFAVNVLTLLARKEADAVIIPYFDMLRMAHDGPSASIYKNELYPFVRELEESGVVDVTTRNSYVVFRIKPELVGKGSDLASDIYRKYCVGTICLKSKPFRQDNTFTQVGVFNDGSIESSNKAGFLIYGQYAPMKAGDFRLSVKGTVQSAGSSAWADVVSNNGAISYGRFPLKNSGGDGYTVANERVHLSDDVTDMEIRIFVDKDDKIKIDSYSLGPD